RTITSASPVCTRRSRSTVSRSAWPIAVLRSAFLTHSSTTATRATWRTAGRIPPPIRIWWPAAFSRRSRRSRRAEQPANWLCNATPARLAWFGDAGRAHAFLVALCPGGGVKKRRDRPATPDRAKAPQHRVEPDRFAGGQSGLDHLVS